MRISYWSSDVCSSDLPCELLVVLQESQGHVRHRLMRPIILRNVPQQSRIAVRVDEVATEDVPGWTNIGVSAAKLSGVALVDEKVEPARSLLELVANRHRVLVLLRAEAIGFVEDQAEHVDITFYALLVARTPYAGDQHMARWEELRVG